MKTDGKIWDQFAREYENKVFSVTSSPVRRKMFLKYLKPPFILNLGSGPLPFMNQELINKAFKIIANDISKNMIHESAKRFSHINLKFVNTDNCNLSFKDETFDSVLSINSILPEYRNEVDQMLNEIFRVLKNFGVFVGFFPSWEASIKAEKCFGQIEILDHSNLRVYETTGWQCYQSKETIYKHLKNSVVSVISCQKFDSMLVNQLISIK